MNIVGRSSFSRSPRSPALDALEEDSSGTKKLGSSVDAYLASQGLHQASVLATIVSFWSEIVGPNVAGHATPRSLRESELVVGVDHAAWATELAFLSEGVCAALNDRFDYPVATRLKVHVEARSRLD